MVCRFCNAQIEGEYECTECGAILKTAPPRREENRPKRELYAIVESSNHNGRYHIYKLPDGSFSCDCLSFLQQKGTKVTEQFPFRTCKHIRDRVRPEDVQDFKVSTTPSNWQKILCKKFGVVIPEGVTNAQAYSIIEDLLPRQGFDYRELVTFLKETPKPQFLPLRYFGVEFEGGLGCSREEFKHILSDAEIESLVCGYDHTLHNKKWKLGTDSSVNVPNLNPVEIVSPKLYGATGFKEIERVLKLWNETLPLREGSSERIPGVNRTCGTHVHVDAYGWDNEKLLRLAKVWAKIEIPIVWYLVSDSRRGGRYCSRIDLEDLIGLSENRLPDRYHSLNYQALHRQGSIEFRIHNGTLEAQKIIPWITFCLCLTDAVLDKGLSHRDFDPTFDGIMDAVGMNGSSSPLLKNAREYLHNRYEYWQEEVRAGRSDFPSVQPIDVDNLEAELRRIERERRAREIRSSFVSRRGLTTRDPNAPSNSILNLASMRPSSIIGAERYLMLSEGVWQVPSRDGQSSYTVSHDSESDTLSCNCRGFRTHGHCFHSINLARYIYTQRELEAVETEINQGGNSHV